MPRFLYWPFQIAAGPDGSLVWADREELRKALDDLLLGVKPSRPSTLINIWAYYGAGKTYALRYLERGARDAGIWSVYSVTPQGAVSFLDVYRSIASALSDEQLAAVESELELSSSDVGQSLYRSLRVKSIGSASQAALATMYLTGRKTSAAQRRDLNAIVDLNYAAHAAEALVITLKALGRTRGVVLLLDEVQNLSLMKPRALGETSGLLQQVFDGVQHGLRIVASFTTGMRETIRDVLGEALYHRASRLIEIPEFSEDEAVRFLRELIRPARSDARVGVFEPFSEARMREMILAIREGGEKLVPREIIKGADNMYEPLGD